MSTIVEFYDEDDLNNVLSVLTYAPERVVYIVPERIVFEPFLRRYREVLAHQGIGTRLESRPIDLMDYNGILRTLTELVAEDDACAFEMTGGTDVTLTAMGIVSARCGVPLLRFEEGTRIPCWYQGDCPFGMEKRIRLTSEDWFLLYGASFDPENAQVEQWELSDALGETVLILWEFARKNLDAWNGDCHFLVRLAKKSVSRDPLVIDLPYSVYHGEQRRDYWEYSLLTHMRNHGLIRNFEINKSEDRVHIELADGQLLHVLKKAGNLLELYTYYMARSTGDFDECRLGVFINWDGPEAGDQSQTTTNELDVVAIRGAEPVFLSCKNGGVQKSALYELDSLADRFGGRNVRCILVATGEAGESVLRRAQRMGIHLVDQVDMLTPEEFREKVFGTQ